MNNHRVCRWYPAWQVDNNLAVVEGSFPAPTNLTACYGQGGVTMEQQMMYMNTEGCYMAFEEWVKSRALYIGGVGLGLAFLEVRAEERTDKQTFKHTRDPFQNPAQAQANPLSIRFKTQGVKTGNLGSCF